MNDFVEAVVAFIESDKGESLIRKILEDLARERDGSEA